MKKIMKILFLNGMVLFGLKGTAFAAEATEDVNMAKIFFIGVAVIAISSILYLAYKSDNRVRDREYEKPKKVSKKKDTIQDELVEKDTTYEVEDDEFYMDDKIDPVKVDKDEDEVSLFESINNPDTLAEEIDALPTFSNNADKDTTVEEKKENIEGTMVFDSNSLKEETEDVVDDMLNLEDESEDLETGEEGTEEANDEFDYDYSEIEEEIKEENAENNLDDVNEELNILENNSEDIEEELEEAEEEAKEASSGFAGFATIGSSKQSKNKTVFERYSDTIKKDKKEVEKKEEPKKVQKAEEPVMNVSSGDSSDDFLAQMEQNLNGGNVEEPVEKKVAKKTAAKKTTTKKATTKTSTKTAEKKTTIKKTAAKKTTKTAKK